MTVPWSKFGHRPRRPFRFMMAASNGNVFRVPSPLWREFTGHRWIPFTKTSDVDVFFNLRLNKRLSKPSRRRWFQTPSRSLWRHSIVEDSHWGNKTKRPTICKRNFQMYFLEWKCLNFYSNFTKSALAREPVRSHQLKQSWQGFVMIVYNRHFQHFWK